MASATEATNGVPPNVDAWVPAVSPRATGSRATMAPMGTPFASPLASVMISGSTPQCWYPQSVPVRPKPVWTSSRIRSAPASSQSFLRPGRYPSSGTFTPPSPWTGSSRTAAVRLSSARSTARRSL